MLTVIDKIPWATYGRQESAAEFRFKLQQQTQYLPILKSEDFFSLVYVVQKEDNFAEFKETLSALQASSYSNWEALFVSNEKLPEFKVYLHHTQNPHFKWLDSPTEKTLFELKNFAARQARGNFLGFLTLRDILSPIGFFHLARERKPNSQVLYFNEVFLSANAKQIEKYYSKPQFSYFNLIHFNYLHRGWFIDKTLFDKLNGFSSSMTSPAYDLLMRATEMTAEMQLVPEFLLYCKDKPSFSDHLSIESLSDHLKKRGIPSEIRESRVIPTLSEPYPLVSVIICFRDKPNWTIQCLRSLEKAKGKCPLEVLLVNNQSNEESLQKIREILPDLQFTARLLDYPEAFNFGEMHNGIVREEVSGEHLLFLNNDVFWLSGSIDELVSWSSQPWVGTVGMRLLFPDGRIQHGGFRAVYGGYSRMARIHHAQDSQDFLLENREVFGNTFASCMVKTGLFKELGGLDSLKYPNGHGDVAFNFQCLRKGLHNLYLGHVSATHEESGSRGLSYEYWEECGIEKEYPDIFQRMLREDLGFNRVPDAGVSIKGLLKTGLLTKGFLRNRFLFNKMMPFLKQQLGRTLADV